MQIEMHNWKFFFIQKEFLKSIQTAIKLAYMGNHITLSESVF